ncbi:MAG: response regulator [Vicinamibacterales bacterium]
MTPGATQPATGAPAPQRRARLLFVDDEAMVLDGLRNILHRDRRLWHIAFAQSGEAALAELTRQPADVVVSDLRMPGMDGATFLSEVRSRWPATARIVLSGHAEERIVVRAAAVAHQYLSKPLEPEALRRTITRTLDLCRLLQDPKVGAAVGRLDRLPLRPSVFLELSALLESERASADQITEVVERDPAICLKMLQLVNSAYFGLARPISSIRQAVVYLGSTRIKELALSAELFGRAIDHDVGGTMEGIQCHSLATAAVARQLVSRPEQGDEAFTAALLHDIGRIVLGLGIPGQYAEIAREAERTARPVHDVERERLGTDHAAVGACLLTLWGLPFSIAEVVAFHESPSDIGDGPCDVLAAVHVADRLVSAARRGAESEVIDRVFLERAGFTPQLERWTAVAQAWLGAHGKSASAHRPAGGGNDGA